MTPELLAFDWRPSPTRETDEAPPSASAPRCVCGAPLPAPTTGRPRSTCSTPCKWRRDAIVRRLRRREVWIAQWRAVDLAAGYHSPTDVWSAIEELNLEIAAIVAQLHGNGR